MTRKFLTPIEVATINGGGGNGSLAITGNWMPYFDGNNYHGANAHIFRSLGGAETWLTVNASGITAALPLLLPADPTQPLQAATKQYVDAQVAVAIQSVIISLTDPIATNPNAELWYDPDA